MSMTSSAMTVLSAVATMVAMMLPSVAPTLRRYHRHLSANGMPRAIQRTALFAAGYVSVWSAIAVAFWALPASSIATWGTAAVLLSAGMLQRSRWKARQLLRCRESCLPAWRPALRDGCRFGVDCSLSCAAPMAVLYALGMMDWHTMILITAVITAERVAPGGVRIAQLTGGVALVAGLSMCM